MMRVSVDGVVTYIEPGECYVESTDRAGGVWVIAPTDGVSIGSRVTATGTFALINGEPVIKDAVLSPQGTQGDIRPFAMSNRNIGGAPWLSSTWIQDFTSSRQWAGRWRVERATSGCW